MDRNQKNNFGRPIIVLSNPILSIYLHIEHKIFPMKKIIFFAILTSVSFVFSQSKKEQIEILTNRVDSLNRVVGAERNINKQKSENILQLKETNGNLQNQIAKLNESVKFLNQEINEKENSLSSKAFEISVLKTQLIEKLDSLAKIRAELEKLKPVPKPVVSNTTNQVTQTGSYKSVKIGTQTWMTENLNVSTFRNGDPIPQAKSNEEWDLADENKQPAWCYYENDPKNGNKYGKLYNWYAVNDPRGLAPAGWHIPTDAEWTTLENQLGDDAGKKMKSTSGWDSWYEKITCSNCKVASAEYKKICSVCKGTGYTGKKTHSGNGTNSSGFSGLPGGLRRGNGAFDTIGGSGNWWSSTEYTTSGAWARYLNYNGGDVGRDANYFSGKEKGFSVRCLRD